MGGLEGRWLEVPHPVVSVTSGFPDFTVDGEVGVLGNEERGPLRHVDGVVRSVGGRPARIRPGWQPLEPHVFDLRGFQTLLLYYAPTPGVGRSSALSTALGAGRPIVCSEAGFLSDAAHWGGVADLDDLPRAIRAALDRGGVPDERQAAWAAECGAERLARGILERVV